MVHYIIGKCKTEDLCSAIAGYSANNGTIEIVCVHDLKPDGQRLLEKMGFQKVSAEEAKKLRIKYDLEQNMHESDVYVIENLK